MTQTARRRFKENALIVFYGFVGLLAVSLVWYVYAHVTGTPLQSTPEPYPSSEVYFDKTAMIIAWAAIGLWVKNNGGIRGVYHGLRS